MKATGLILLPTSTGSATRRRALRRRGGLWLALTALTLIVVPAGIRAQTCFIYSDTINALLPLSCVQKADHGVACAWPTDCDSIVSPSSQTILRMHTRWHDCFGNVGGSSPPVGRGDRWYAFHRQFEFDFNRWREGIGFSKIESLNWCRDMLMPEGHPSAMPGGISGHPASCGVGNPRPDDTACIGCEAFPPCLFHSGAGPACASGDVGNPLRCPPGITALGQQASGVWRLRVSDNAGGGVGQLNEWGLAVTGFSPAPRPAAPAETAAALHMTPGIQPFGLTPP